MPKKKGAKQGLPFFMSTDHIPSVYISYNYFFSRFSLSESRGIQQASFTHSCLKLLSYYNRRMKWIAYFPVSSLFCGVLALGVTSQSHAEQETYLEYVERINSKKHIFKAGEDLANVLKKKGYSDIYKHHGALNQTYWKNGFRPNNEKLKPGATILLPYVKEQRAARIVPVVRKSILRLPASSKVDAKPRTHSARLPASLRNEFNPQSRLTLLAGYDFFRVEAVDKQTKDTAILVSEASPKITFKWEVAWSERWSVELSFLYRQDKVKNDSQSLQKLDKTSYSRLSGSLGLNRTWSERNQTQFFIARSERGFLRAESPTALRIDSATSTDLGIKHAVSFFSHKTVSAGFEALASYLGSAEAGGYSADPGYLAGGSLYLRHQLKGFLLEGRGSYSIWRQDSPFVTQDARELGTSIAIGWVFE